MLKLIADALFTIKAVNLSMLHIYAADEIDIYFIFARIKLFGVSLINNETFYTYFYNTYYTRFPGIPCRGAHLDGGRLADYRASQALHAVKQYIHACDVQHAIKMISGQFPEHY